MSVFAYIGLGSNMGNKADLCKQAIAMLSRAGKVTKISSYYCTEPIGYQEQDDFINAAAEVETDLPPADLLAVCHTIEDELGRSRLVRWGPRSIDLDILLYGTVQVNTQDLVIPHPLMASRGFVLIPLAEIAPQAVHPVLNKTIAHLLHELKDAHRVVVVDPSKARS